MRTAILVPWLIIGLVGYLLMGCSANVHNRGCEAPSFANPSGVSRQIMPSYIERYGCETFEGMNAEGFSAFCAMEFPETEGSWAGDIEVGCNPSEESCEQYWLCE